MILLLAYFLLCPVHSINRLFCSFEFYFMLSAISIILAKSLLACYHFSNKNEKNFFSCYSAANRKNWTSKNSNNSEWAIELFINRHKFVIKTDGKRNYFASGSLKKNKIKIANLKPRFKTPKLPQRIHPSCHSYSLYFPHVKMVVWEVLFSPRRLKFFTQKVKFVWPVYEPVG